MSELKLKPGPDDCLWLLPYYSTIVTDSLRMETLSTCICQHVYSSENSLRSSSLRLLHFTWKDETNTFFWAINIFHNSYLFLKKWYNTDAEGITQQLRKFAVFSRGSKFSSKMVHSCNYKLKGFNILYEIRGTCTHVHMSTHMYT